MESTKWIYHNERRYGSNFFLFSKILFNFKNLAYRVDLMYQPNVRIHTFRKRFISGCFFPVSFLNNIKTANNIKKVTVTDGRTDVKNEHENAFEEKIV